MSFDAVDQAIADGRLWRAKELLQGRLASPEFNSDVLHRYGLVLLAMGDKIDAGRMLFCSGFRSPEYLEAIGLFLARNRRDNPGQFLSALPLMVRRQAHLVDFITSTEFELKGWNSEVLAAMQPAMPKAAKALMTWQERLREKASNALGMTVAMLFFVSFVVGAITILRTIWSIFAG